MNSVTLELEDDLTALLAQMNQPLTKAARELMVMELYRRGRLSSGKAAEYLALSRHQFIAYASKLGIAFLDMTEDEWKSEQARGKSL